jgi:hypothetical protein
VPASREIHFTPNGVSISAGPMAINMQPLRGCREFGHFEYVGHVMIDIRTLGNHYVVVRHDYVVVCPYGAGTPEV